MENALKLQIKQQMECFTPLGVCRSLVTERSKPNLPLFCFKGSFPISSIRCCTDPSFMDCFRVVTKIPV